ncbi:hypothetical protein ACMC56_09960 [Campylobacterota bacterium DY0563]
MKKAILISILSIFVLGGCFGQSSSEQEWTSLIYPDKNNTKRSKKHGVFKTIEECRKSSLAELKNLNLETVGDYQCGLNCKFHEGMKVDICEKLSK